MTVFDAGDTGAFVHAQFSDGTSRLVGRYRLVSPNGGRAFGEFAYVGSWLRNDHGRAFALDPANLPLVRTVFTTTKRGRLPGVLADSTPDRWGRRLVQNARPENSPLMQPRDWLFATGDERVGCLAFSQTSALPERNSGFADVTDLDAIASAFRRLESGEATGGLAEGLWRAGFSMGGARPKAVVAHEGALWIAKFERHDDTYDQCAAEHATMRLAEACGITVAETRLMTVGPRRAVLVKRFDRTENDGSYRPTGHYISGLSLLDIDETSDAGSYIDLAGCLRRYGTRHVEDRCELFRRMIFNVLSGNRDDHLKNHAFLRTEDGAWRLSPAFDIVPQPDMDPGQAIAVGRSGGFPSIQNCLTMVAAFDLGQDEGRSIIARMIEAMRPWRDFLGRNAVPEATIRRLASAFARELDAEGSAPSSSGRG